MSSGLINFLQTFDAPLLLDLYPANIAWSLRSLSDDFRNSNIIRVKRSSDSTLNNFSAEEITNGTLESWVGLGNVGNVETIFDQSGSDINLQFSTSKNIIVNASGLLTYQGFPYVLYDGTNETPDFNLSNPSALTNTNGSIFQLIDTNTDGIFADFDGGNVFGIFQPNTSATDFGVGANVTYYANGVQVVKPNTRQKLRDVWRLNTRVLATGEDINFSASAVWNTAIFPNVYTAQSLSGQQKFKEFIVYDSNQSANRIAIENNINEYYNIY